MKIQCACGAKYSFDVTPEMLQNPVRFVCPSCGRDASDYVNELIRRELAGPPPAPPAAPEAPRLRISHAQPEPATLAGDAASAPPVEEHCAKHPRETAVSHCVVCGKPMCRRCMTLFGRVCSPLCRAKAESQNMDVPVYAGQSSVARARLSRRVGVIGGSIAALVVAALGFWIWYAWIGSVPHAAFSIRFDNRAYAGESRFCGTNQIVFLHGVTLARCDLKSGKEIWSRVLIPKQQIADAVAREYALAPTDQFGDRISQSRIKEAVSREFESELHLHVSGQHVWVSTPDKLTRYDWATGKVLQQIPLAGRTEILAHNGEFLLMSEGAHGQALLTHVNPATGESRVEKIGQPGQMLVATAASGGAGQATGGLPLSPIAGGTGPMNPTRVGQEAQNLTLPGRLALPAVLANESEEEQIAEELKADDGQTASRARAAAKQLRPMQNANGQFTLVPSPYGDVEFAVKLLKAHIVTREAMKAPSTKSALNGNLTAAAETAAANETLNEMQRRRGGGTVQEDDSLYQVSLRQPGSTGPAAWTGQVTGPPALYPLKTVNVLAANKTLIVFDKTDKKLWQAALTYKVAGGGRAASGETSPFGAGPCVEHGDTLYVIDQALLTAFDPTTGSARWRLPSVGIVGLFFDDKGMLYVNTTTANPENIKYSRQIDITQDIEADLLKIDPKTGRTLWSVKPGGFISYLSGNYVYTVQSYNPGDQAGTPANILSPAYVKIRRINPANGQQMWEYDEGSAPLDVQFKKNSIALVFKKEVQVLKYFSL